MRPFALLFLSAALLGPAAALAAPPEAAPRSAPAIDPEAILQEPDAPVAGDPRGDVTIVAFLDDGCPFCKRSTPDLDCVVEADGHIRLVWKDWPILTRASVAGARLAPGFMARTSTSPRTGRRSTPS